MTDDTDLRRALAAADAAAPPAIGAPITWARLQARRQRRHVQRALAATLVLTCGAATSAWLRTPPSATHAATLTELRLQLDALRARLDVLDDTSADVHELQRRSEIAALRATTAITHAPIAMARFAHATSAPERAPSPNPSAGSAGAEDHR